MFYDEKAWMRLREDSFRYVKNLEETVIKKWLDEIGYTDPVGYYRDSLNKEMTIYTTRPGILIGKAGVTVHKFEKMLSDEFRGDWHVKFVEVRGGFVNVGK